MKQADVVTLLEQLSQANVPKKVHGTNMSGEVAYVYDTTEATKWVLLAATALAAAFPEHHPVRRKWDALVEPGKVAIEYDDVFVPARAVVDVALSLVKSGALDTVYDGIRMDTVSEVLEQADALAAGNHLVAATVLAGGALETHLLHLCNKHGLTWPGAGSIEKYNGAISQARNAGNEIYSASDTKDVTAWGGRRNDAAHSPTTYSAIAAEVRLMVEGVRQFVRRTP